MTPLERETQLAELIAQQVALQSSIDTLDRLDIAAEVGLTPTRESLEAVKRKLTSIKTRIDATKGGGKLSRSETVTVRLDPKLRHLAELAARLQRRTLSSYIEWAIERSLDNNFLAADPADGRGPSVRDESEYLWDVDEADRFAKLALRYPHLLTHEEQVRWKLIRETVMLWTGGFPGDAERTLDFEKLRRNWAVVTKAAAEGKVGPDLDFLVE